MTANQIPIFNSKPPGIIKTTDDSLFLRLISLEDERDFYNLGLDPDVARFNNYNIHTLKDARDKINSFLREIGNLERFSYSIIKNNKFAGYYGIWVENNNPGYFREGVAIFPKYRRQGIYSRCSEAMVRVLKLQYRHINLVDNVDASNIPSIEASKSRGFKQDGLNEIGELRFVKKIL